jgi:hypothetical protein
MGGVSMANAKIYFNLHKKVFSVQVNGKVVDHVKNLHILGATFRVSEAGRQRVINEKRKNVHAYVVAPIENIRKVTNDQGNVSGWDAVTYNPYRDATFVRKETREAIHQAYEVCLSVDDNKRPSIYVKG